MLVFRKKMHTFAVILQANNTSMRFITIIFALLTVWNASAQKDTTRVFSVEEPLVYVDAKDWWPYAFLDEAGEPDGYNITGKTAAERTPYTLYYKAEAKARGDGRYENRQG